MHALTCAPFSCNDDMPRATISTEMAMIAQRRSQMRRRQPNRRRGTRESAPKPAATKPVLKTAAVAAALEKHCRRHSYEVAQLAASQPVAPPSLAGPSGAGCPREALATFCKEADAQAIVRAHELANEKVCACER